MYLLNRKAEHNYPLLFFQLKTQMAKEMKEQSHEN